MLARVKMALRALLRRAEVESELDEELRYHIERQAAQNERLGMAPEEARREARKAFGGVEQAKERSRDVRGGRWLEELWQDLRYGVRMLRKSPGFTVVAILTLGLGIGANTAIFSVVNAVLISPLPYRAPDRLVQVWEHNRPRNEPRYSVAPANFFDWQEQNQAFEQMSAVEGASFNLTGFNLTGDWEPERLQAARVSASLLPLLGVEPIAGRTFTAEEEQRGHHQVVLVSHGLWQRRFGSDPELVGQMLTLNDQSFTVVGILPPDFNFLPREFELLTPLSFDAREAAWRGSHPLRVIARLKEGVTIARAQAEMDQIASRLEQQYPEFNAGKGVTLVPLQEQLVGETRRALLILLGAVTFVLLIACANVANLQLARAVTRQKEMALRTALGAGRGRLIRQLLTESVLLAVAGGSAGLLLAFWGIQALKTILAQNALLPRGEEVGVDGGALAFTFAISLVTGLAFGLAPALTAANKDLNNVLKEGGRGTGGARDRRFRQSLVVVEVALALVLLVGAGLMIQSLWRLQRVDPGFQPENVLAVELSLPSSRYQERRQIADFHRRLFERIGGLPGVRSVGGAAYLPFSGTSNAWVFRIEGRPPQPPGQGLMAGWRPVTPDYFKTMGIPLIWGRDFTERDGEETPGVAIINEAAVRAFWPGEDPLGQRFTQARRTYSIVGIVKDVRHFRLDGEPAPEIYFPYPQLSMPWRSMTVVVRSESTPERLAEAVRGAVLELDKDLPIYNVRKLEGLIDNSVSRPRFQLLLLGTFAALALAMASLGLYGVMSYAVTQRTQEIGIRLALGAQPRDVLRSEVWRGLTLALSGVGVGLLAAFALTRVMASLLYGVSATDPLTFAAIAVLLIAVALMACYLPARRAAKVDPLVALRYE